MSQQYRVLAVDRDEATRKLVLDELKRRGYAVDECGSEDEAIERASCSVYDLVLHGFELDSDGEYFLNRIKEITPELGVIAMTSRGTMESAIAALNAGAVDYIPKPVDRELLGITVERILEDLRIHKEYLRGRREVRKAVNEKCLLGNSPQMLDVYKQVTQVARHQVNVLITGETGTGKELIAKAVHVNSMRSEMPFVAVNCASIPDTLLESELFGHVKGAFTGAIATRKGLFEQASGGTVFLDEIGEISNNRQVKLLRVVQEKEIRRLGDEKTIEVDVRIIAATNKVIEQQVEKGDFREDLYYRLGSVTIHLPPLRERKGDIELLAYHFLDRFNENEETDIEDISEEAMEILTNHDWPGNVRELEGVIERAVIVCKGEQVSLADLPARIIPQAMKKENPSPEMKDISGRLEFKIDHRHMTLAEAEKEYLLYILEVTNGNKSQAARAMGIGRRSLYRMLDRHNISQNRLT